MEFFKNEDGYGSIRNASKVYIVPEKLFNNLVEVKKKHNDFVESVQKNLEKLTKSISDERDKAKDNHDTQLREYEKKLKEQERKLKEQERKLREYEYDIQQLQKEKFKEEGKNEELSKLYKRLEVQAYKLWLIVASYKLKYKDLEKRLYEIKSLMSPFESVISELGLKSPILVDFYNGMLEGIPSKILRVYEDYKQESLKISQALEEKNKEIERCREFENDFDLDEIEEWTDMFDKSTKILSLSGDSEDSGIYLI